MHSGDIPWQEKRVFCYLEKHEAAITMIYRIVFMLFVNAQKIAMGVVTL